MPILSKEILQNIRKIQISSIQLAKDVFAGMYKSAFKGKGMEFEEVREYQPGDEVRHIDWNVTARMNHPYVKNFREERDLTVLLVVDVSGSSYFGTQQHSKAEFMAELGGVLAFSAMRNQDRVGLILFSDIVEKYIPPRKGNRHVLRIIRELLAFKPTHRKSDLRVALNFLGKVQERPSICFIVSDFICPDYAHEANLIAQRHDLVALCISDPDERSFPRIGVMQVTDLETNQEAVVDTLSMDFQGDYTKRTNDRILNVKKIMQKIGAGFVDIRTDQSYVAALRKFFTLRARRRQ